MVTLNELIYDLRGLIEPNSSDDSNADDRQYTFWINNQRALWLRNELNKNRTVDDNVIQDLGCIELEVADKADCCELSDGCKVLRTVLQIPNAIELHNKTGITRVAPINKLEVPFNFVDYERAIWSGNGRYNKKQIFAFLLNNRIYLTSKDNGLSKYLTHINVRGVFEDPTEAANFVDCDDVPCYTNNSKYPVNRWMIEYMKSEILKINITTIVKGFQDTTNNAKSDITNEPK